MLENKDIAYLEWVVSMSDDDRAWDIWQTLKTAVLAQQTNNRQIMPCCPKCRSVNVSGHLSCSSCNSDFIIGTA